MAVICVFLPDLNPTAYGFTATTGTIIDGPVLVRKEPVNEEGPITLNPGATVTVTDEVQGSDGHIWYQLQVTVSGVTQTGYTRSDFVRLDSAGTNTEGNAVVANTDVGVNVRSGAGTSYQVVIKVYKGQRITVQAETRAEGLRWYNISFSLRGGSYSGWICADYVTLDGGVSQWAAVSARQRLFRTISMCRSLGCRFSGRLLQLAAGAAPEISELAVCSGADGAGLEYSDRK